MFRQNPPLDALTGKSAANDLGANGQADARSDEEGGENRAIDAHGMTDGGGERKREYSRRDEPEESASAKHPNDNEKTAGGVHGEPFRGTAVSARCVAAVTQYMEIIHERPGQASLLTGGNLPEHPPLCFGCRRIEVDDAVVAHLFQAPVL